MKKIKIGIIGTSDIAFRRFLPALEQSEHFEYVGVASRDFTKTKKFINKYGGIGYDGYDKLIEDSNIDAVYIPLPPALHHEWAIKALKKGKHIFLEKPFTTKLAHTMEIITLARSRNLCVHENYMFLFHSQLKQIKDIITGGLIGDSRLIRIAFGFPMRSLDDFRYNKCLGGGALLDCGGYTVRLATELLGNTTSVVTAKLNYTSEFEVDIYGSAVFKNSSGQVAQVSFGMDNSYKCELEIWGSKGTLLSTRIFTTGSDLQPEVFIKNNIEEKKLVLPLDNQFLNSINHFNSCIKNENLRTNGFQEIISQSYLIEEVFRIGNLDES